MGTAPACLAPRIVPDLPVADHRGGLTHGRLQRLERRVRLPAGGAGRRRRRRASLHAVAQRRAGTARGVQPAVQPAHQPVERVVVGANDHQR
jgi:hypothetical protein